MFSGKEKSAAPSALPSAAAYSTEGAFTLPAVPALQKKDAEELVQGKWVTQLVAEEELPAQAKADPVQKQESAAAANHTGMPSNLKSGIENLSGTDMSDVRVHYNSDKPAGLQALAYAQGNAIHIGPGQEQHLPHEAWHVVQQKQGRVQATLQLKEGIPVNDDPGLEREADIMGAKALNI